MFNKLIIVISLILCINIVNILGFNDIDNDFTVLHDLHKLLLDDQFNSKKIISLMNDLNDKTLLDFPISDQIPIGHHLLNKYFLSNDLTIRKDIIEVLIKAIEYGIDVDIGFNNDPHLIFKSIAIRELDLTSHLTTKSNYILSNFTTNPSILPSITQMFNMLYGLPCEPVPLMKLLLHADNIVRSKPESYKDIETIKRLLISASLGTNSKPSAKTIDLIAHSKAYNNILHSLGQSPNDGIYLHNVIQSLDELGSHTQRNLLNKLTHSDNDYLFNSLIDIFAQVDSNKRNPLHHIAISGSVVMLRELVQSFTHIVKSNAINIDQIKSKLTKLLIAKDNRGLQPYKYAALRYGVTSNTFIILSQLYHLLDIAIDVDELSNTFPSVNNITSYECKDHTCANAEIQLSINASYEITGGWDDSRLSEDIIDDINRCDIEVQWGPVPSYNDFFNTYIRTGTPVIFRGANGVDSKIRSAFTRDSFVSRYGDDIVPLSTIPYAGSFGVQGSYISLRDIANITELIDDQTPVYAFSTPSNKWLHKLQEDVAIPDCISGSVSHSKGNVEVQFYLGPKGSGAPVHFHGHAVNSLAYGEKKWYLFPPSEAFYSTMPAFEFVSSDSRAHRSIQCTQRSGDVMYVPTLWGHATLNVKQSIGVAHEFSIESFCME